MKNKGLILLNLSLIIPLLGLISFATSQPKIVKGYLDPCELKNGQQGLLKGVVTTVENPLSGKSKISLSEGTQGCTTVVMIRRNQIEMMGTPGNKVEVPVKVVGQTFVEAIGSPRFSSDVVDLKGNTEELKTIIVKVRDKPTERNPYIKAVSEGYIESFKLSYSMIDEIRWGEKVKLYYSPSTFEVKKIEHL